MDIVHFVKANGSLFCNHGKMIQWKQSKGWKLTAFKSTVGRTEAETGPC